MRREFSNSQESREGSCDSRNELEDEYRFLRQECEEWVPGRWDSHKERRIIGNGEGVVVVTGHKWPGGQWVDFSLCGRHEGTCQRPG